MEIELTSGAERDLTYWKKTNNQAVLKRISALIESICENPSRGIGKPERLTHNLAGKWSRRITDEHRIVYEIDGSDVVIHSLKGHYE